MKIVFIIILVLAKFLIINAGYSDECEHNIFERCNHRSEFTKEEIENARKWLQEFMYKADIKPVKPACKRLRVRKDFKCLSHKERLEFVRVIRRLYETGVMDEFADIHQRYWAEVHKTTELGPWHRWFNNELEKRMRKINPLITLPYYGAQIDASSPEKSIVWKYLGYGGIHYNGFCVRNGLLYSNLSTTRCVKRQWNSDGTIPPIDGPELNTMWLHLSKNFILANFLDSGLHFLTHLAFGGYRGDMSVDTAPFDIMFYLWHNYQMDIVMLKKQLQDHSRATPLDYNTLFRIDQVSGQKVQANLETDVLTYYRVPVVEAYQQGFGELCSITDQMVIAINQKIRNETVVPLAVKRLPLAIKAQFFPKFMSGHFDAFTHMFEEVGDCNKQCLPMPHFQTYVSTENGMRLLRRYVYDENTNVALLLIVSQAFYSVAVKEMNSLGYCSPYVNG